MNKKIVVTGLITVGFLNARASPNPADNKNGVSDLNRIASTNSFASSSLSAEAIDLKPHTCVNKMYFNLYAHMRTCQDVIHLERFIYDRKMTRT
jgi:hypothetical protein